MGKAAEHPFADPERNIDHHQEKADILRMRSGGLSMVEIAEQTGLSLATVMRRLKEIADDTRDRHVEIADEMFAVHQARLEALYRKINERIAQLEVFDDRVFRAAVMVLERQAKLLGLDREKRDTGRAGQNDWIESATADEVVRRAKELGINVPEKFDVTRR